MFVQTQKTPNPNSLKFLPGKKISDGEPMEFTKKEKNESPLLRSILSIDGVESIFLGSDFLSVNKNGSPNDIVPVEDALVLMACDDLVPALCDEGEEVVGALRVRVALLVALHVREVDARVEHGERAVLHEERECGLVLGVAHAEALGPRGRHGEPVPHEQPVVRGRG